MICVKAALRLANYDFCMKNRLLTHRWAAISALAICVVLVSGPAWANAGIVVIGFPAAGVIFFLVPFFEHRVLVRFIKMENSKAMDAVLWGNMASAIVGFLSPISVRLAENLAEQVSSKASLAIVLPASILFVAVAAGISTAVELPIIHRFASGNWWPKSRQLVMKRVLVVLAMNLVTTVFCCSVLW